MGQQAASTGKHLPINPALGDYLARSGTAPHEALLSLLESTNAVGEASGMMVPIEQAGLLTILTKLLSATVALDIGTFTGMSALAIARGLAPGGTVTSCDVTSSWIEVARRHWELAGVADRIDFKLGPAGRTMRSFDPGSVDLIFVDADKMNYPDYYRTAVTLLRPGGLLLLDNVLLDGYVLAPELAADSLMARCASTLRTVNAEVAADGRLESVMLPIADGLTIARKL